MVEEEVRPNTVFSSSVVLPQGRQGEPNRTIGHQRQVSRQVSRGNQRSRPSAPTTASQKAPSAGAQTPSTTVPPWSQTRLRRTQARPPWQGPEEPSRGSNGHQPDLKTVQGKAPSFSDKRRVSRITRCTDCHPQSSSVSTPAQTTPCLVIETADTGSDSHLVGSQESSGQQSSREALRHHSTKNKINSTPGGGPTSRIASQSNAIEAGLRRSPIASGPPARPGPPSHMTAAQRPQNAAPQEHMRTWRIRYLDLSLELEQTRLQQRQPQIDIGIGGVAPGHDCGDYGIEGLTIVMHMKGKDDLVINTDLTREGSVCEHN